MKTKTDPEAKRKEELEALDLLFTTTVSSHSSDVSREARNRRSRAEKVLQECIVIAHVWRDMIKDAEDILKQEDIKPKPPD